MNSNHKKPPATVPALPVDVIVDILYRLPVKTLLRFRCLSKQFRSIIDGPDFINRHLQFHRSLNRRRLIVQGKGKRPDFFCIDLDSADNVFKLELPFESCGSVHLIGSCDGLLAPSINDHTTICLWNISTRKHQFLPQFWSDYRYLCYVDYRYIYYVVLDGLGYDVATDDYKLVRVMKDCYAMIQVLVYSLKANSWRRIEDRPPYHKFFVNGMGVLVGGALNWVVRVLDIHECRVMSFDMKGDNFDEVLLPNLWDEAEFKAEFRIVALEGCLCLSYFSPFWAALDIWVMKEYRVKESWTKLFTLWSKSPLVYDGYYLGLVALTYSKSSYKVLVDPYYGEVDCRDLDKETDVAVEIYKGPTFIQHATIYLDSLVSPKVSR